MSPFVASLTRKKRNSVAASAAAVEYDQSICRLFGVEVVLVVALVVVLRLVPHSRNFAVGCALILLEAPDEDSKISYELSQIVSPELDWRGSIQQQHHQLSPLPAAQWKLGDGHGLPCGPHSTFPLERSEG